MRNTLIVRTSLEFSPHEAAHTRPCSVERQGYPKGSREKIAHGLRAKEIEGKMQNAKVKMN
jgi:hypothetical protein